MECIRVLTEKIVLVKALLPESFNWFGSTLDNTLETNCVSSPQISEWSNSHLSYIPTEVRGSFLVMWVISKERPVIPYLFKLFNSKEQKKCIKYKTSSSA